MTYALALRNLCLCTTTTCCGSRKMHSSSCDDSLPNVKSHLCQNKPVGVHPTTSYLPLGTPFIQSRAQSGSRDVERSLAATSSQYTRYQQQQRQLRYGSQIRKFRTGWFSVRTSKYLRDLGIRLGCGEWSTDGISSWPSKHESRDPARRERRPRSGLVLLKS